ncbi:MFS transporter [Saccharomonospora sp. NPDC046836]|uniref:MFS transporter n=1 Tax=Saccharomonospora sp. NPDC046836 TaxID=3156921 RepID=UPI0033FC566D
MPSRRDYRLFLAGQTISSLGSSFTTFGLPLLVFRLTGSPTDLALTTIATFLPYLLFGLLIGAWVDRVDRRRLLIYTTVASGLTVAVLPTMAACGVLHVWIVYMVAFVRASLGIVAHAVEGSAMPSLVSRERLADANGKLRAGSAAAQVAGPILAGALIGGGLPIVEVFVVDAVAFWIAATLLVVVRSPFNRGHSAREPKSVRSEIVVGLRYVLADPLLRNIALHAALYNLLGSIVTSQLVFFAHDRLGATDAQVSVLFGCGAIGTAAALFVSARLRHRLPFAAATLGVMMCWSALILGFSASTSFWLGAILWTVAAGLPTVYAVQTLTFRQLVVPDHLLARVQTTGQVLAWSVQPLGAFVGAAIIEATAHIAAVYAGAALLMALGTAGFWTGPLGKATRPSSAVSST